LTEDEIVAALRANLAGMGAVREQRMFGGTGFMLNGNMIAGTFRKNLLVRVGKDNEARAMARPGTTRMEMGGRPMEGYVNFDAATLTDASVAAALKLALPFVLAMPPKAERTKPSKTMKGQPK
jgi:TfoX/Sxy family transcriptional regulator of competence genes